MAMVLALEKRFANSWQENTDGKITEEGERFGGVAGSSLDLFERMLAKASSVEAMRTVKCARRNAKVGGFVQWLVVHIFFFPSKNMHFNGNLSSVIFLRLVNATR